MIKFILLHLSGKETRETSRIFYDLDRLWRIHDNFLDAHKKYLEFLNKEYDLALRDELISNLLNGLVGNMSFALSKVDIMRNFSLFIFYYMFGGERPCRLRHSDEYINFHLHPEILRHLIIPANERTGFTKTIAKFFVKKCDSRLSKLCGFPDFGFTYDVSRYRIISNWNVDKKRWIELAVPDEAQSFKDILGIIMTYPSIKYERNFLQYNLKSALYKRDKRNSLLEEASDDEEYIRNLDYDSFIMGYRASEEEAECYAYWSTFDLVALHRIGEENRQLGNRSYDKSITIKHNARAEELKKELEIEDKWWKSSRYSYKLE